MPIARIGQNKAGLGAADLEPIRRPNRTPICPACNTHARIVLLCAVNVVRESVVHRNVIKLRGGLIVLSRPRFSAVERDTHATVIGVRKPIRILRIDPKSVVIAVTRWQQIKGFAAINRTKQPGVHEINCVSGLWISINFAEIPGALPKAAVIIYTGPMLSGVIGTIKSALFRLDDRINAVRIGTGNRDSDLTEDSFGQAIALETFPGNAIIFRSVGATSCP